MQKKWQKSTLIHDKNPQKNRTIRELPQLDEEHLQKKLQLTLYFVVEDWMFSLQNWEQNKDAYS